MSAGLLHLFPAWAWRTSIEALPLAAAAILLSRWRKLPASWRWWLPAIFFVRLAMPRVPEVDWHWWSAVASSSVAAPFVAASGEIAAGSAAAASAFDVLPVLWLMGGCTVVGWVLVSHWRLRKLIARHALPADGELEQHGNWAAARTGLSRCVPLRVMPGWTTMAVCGWRRPVLLIPDDLTHRFSTAQIRGMLLHEMAHVRRRDVLWTWLALGLCALHWFNPLAWLALRRFHADRELACDAAALRALNPAARRDYGEALLLCMEGPALRIAPTLTPFFRRFHELRQRLQMIMKPTSPTVWSRLITALCVPAIAIATFTAARAQQREGDAPKSPDRPSAEGEKPKLGAREGEQPRKAREGDRPRTGEREGDAPKKGLRDGDQPKKGERDGDKPRDGEGARKPGARDGDQSKKGERDGDKPRDGEGVRKPGARDGEQPKTGARDGDRPKTGERDGDRPKTGERDGDKPKAGPREGDKSEAR